MLRYSFIFLFLFLASCGSRKVAVDKTDAIVKVDSSSNIVKNEVVATNNNITTDICTDEFEVTPIDSTKPVIIGNKKYFNAKIKYKKTKSKTVDTTKKVEKKEEVQQVKVVKDKKEKVYKKQVDRKESHAIYWWWLLILFLVALFFYARRKLMKYLL
jgi:ATP-dependent Zn protease